MAEENGMWLPFGDPGVISARKNSVACNLGSKKAKKIQVQEEEKISFKKSYLVFKEKRDNNGSGFKFRGIDSKPVINSIPKKLEIISNGIEVFLRDSKTRELFTIGSVINDYTLRNGNDTFYIGDVIKLKYSDGSILEYEVKRKTFKDLISDRRQHKNIFENM